MSIPSELMSPVKTVEDIAAPFVVELTEKVFVCVHGHFYQPPRENPYLGIIERQPSAGPFSNWNERIYSECYRPNAFARIFNNDGKVLGIINNYEYLSFNIGATLMSWLENHDLETYKRILEADCNSSKRLGGNGNAIGQVYNHIIMPLANRRDKYTQIRWGKSDFRHRFGRETKGMWLAETAVDYPTIEALIDEGIEFIILAPSQAQRCRTISSNDNDPQWIDVTGNNIDTTRPYRCFAKDGRYIDIFFYDGPVSRDMGFADLLHSSEKLADRLAQSIKKDQQEPQLIAVATDGETFGHHKRETEKSLAYAFTVEFARRGWQLTNFAHYLSLFPPTWEVVLKPVTAWSCAHGVGRWQEDCGCANDGYWHQKWRQPLRNALDWLRDELIQVYEKLSSKYLKDPWLARDEYIEVILDRSSGNVEKFLTRHQKYLLNKDEKVDTLRLLEMQRHTLLMYTSCGWFFEELSRPEGVQILRYASRALELALEVAGIKLEEEFTRRLALAPSNLAEYRDGGQVYNTMVTTAQVSFKQVAAHYAISSLFEQYPKEHKIYCYQAHILDYEKRQIGVSTLAIGQLNLLSEITWEEHHFTFAVLHLGGWDFHCCIGAFEGRPGYANLKEEIFTSFASGGVAETILAMTKSFQGEQFFNLRHLFAEERERIMYKLTEETKRRLDQLYTQVYRDNYSIMVAFHRDGLPVPIELQVAAEIALSHRCLRIVTLLTGSQQSISKQNYLKQLDEIAQEAHYLQCNLKIPEVKQTLETLILKSMHQLFQAKSIVDFNNEVQMVIEMIAVGKALCLDLFLEKAQELYYNNLLRGNYINCVDSQDRPNFNTEHLQGFLQLGDYLQVNVTSWYQQNRIEKNVDGFLVGS